MCVGEACVLPCPPGGVRCAARLTCSCVSGCTSIDKAGLVPGGLALLFFPLRSSLRNPVIFMLLILLRSSMLQLLKECLNSLKMYCCQSYPKLMGAASAVCDELCGSCFCVCVYDQFQWRLTSTEGGAGGRLAMAHFRGKLNCVATRQSFSRKGAG